MTPVPATARGTATVEMVGVPMVTFTDSAGSPQVPAAPALLASPEYDAIHRYVPGTVARKGSDVYTPLPITVLVDEKSAAPAQLGSEGPKSRNVMVPVGLNPLARVALSLIVPPAGTEGEASVVIAGVAGVMTERSAGSSHAVGPAAR
jgi:hypothetical protein